MTAPEPQTLSWDGLLGTAPDYEAAPPANRAVWADLSRRLPRDAYPRFPRDTEALTISWSGSHALALPALLDHEERRSDLNARSCSAPGGHSGWR
jgi:hypothetical protein